MGSGHICSRQGRSQQLGGQAVIGGQPGSKGGSGMGDEIDRERTRAGPRVARRLVCILGAGLEEAWAIIIYGNFYVGVNFAGIYR